MSDEKKLNAAKAKLRQAEAGMADLAERMKPYNASFHRLTKDISDAQKDISRIEDKLAQKPRVSDHAVMRYLERKYGFTFDGARQEILTPTVWAAIESGCKSIKVDGVTLKVANNKVITTVI